MIGWETACRFLKQGRSVKVTIPVGGFISNAYRLRTSTFKDGNITVELFQPNKSSTPQQNGKRMDRGIKGVEWKAKCRNVVCAEEGVSRV